MSFNWLHIKPTFAEKKDSYADQEQNKKHANTDTSYCTAGESFRVR